MVDDFIGLYIEHGGVKYILDNNGVSKQTALMLLERLWVTMHSRQIAAGILDNPLCYLLNEFCAKLP